MATQFRQLGSEDTERLVDHLLDWFRLEGRILAPGPARREARRLLADTQGCQAWLLEQRGAVVGYLMLTFQPGGLREAHRARVGALYLAPAVRGQGIGRQAIRFVADLSRWLQVRILNGDSRREDRHAGVLTRATVVAPWSIEPSPRQATA
jgi:GNAT superfamily N-acetyltransferase